MSNILVNNKDKVNKTRKSGVYQISCKYYNAVYISQTGRKIETRIKEQF